MKDLQVDEEESLKAGIIVATLDGVARVSANSLLHWYAYSKIFDNRVDRDDNRAMQDRLRPLNFSFLLYDSC